MDEARTTSRSKIPMYSLIVVTKNNRATIRQTLKSTLAFAKLNDSELIIVDGNSIDGSMQEILSFISKYKYYYKNVTLVRDPGKSSSYARHLGFKASNGNILIFIDGDTMLHKDFGIHLPKEIEEYDVIAPFIKIMAYDVATETFQKFHIFIERFTSSYGKIKLKPDLLPPARIFKREVLKKLGGYPLLSSFFAEDRILTALAVFLGFRYNYSKTLVYFKIDAPGYISYWKKHYRYGSGLLKDLNSIGKFILRNYIITRRLTYINLIIPIFSLFYALKAKLTLFVNFVTCLRIFLLKSLIDYAMFLGEIHEYIVSNKER